MNRTPAGMSEPSRLRELWERFKDGLDLLRKEDREAFERLDPAIRALTPPAAVPEPARCPCGYPMPCSLNVPIGFCKQGLAPIERAPGHPAVPPSEEKKPSA